MRDNTRAKKTPKIIQPEFIAAERQDVKLSKGIIIAVAAITTPMTMFWAIEKCFSKSDETNLENAQNAASAPMPTGIRTNKLNSPIPCTRGVYSPKGIRSVEKLMPGTIILIAIATPEIIYQKKFGAIEMLMARSEDKIESTVRQERARPRYDKNLLLLLSKETKSDGIIPATRPIKMHTDGASNLVSKSSRTRAITQKPRAIPII
jgi:hypothetical protein